MSLANTVGASVLIVALVGFFPVAYSQIPTTIDFPNALATRLGGISDSGQISGSYTGTNNFGYGFSLSGGTFSSISGPGALSTSVGGLSAGGQIVGSYVVASFVTGFLDNDGAFTGLVVPYDSRTEAAGGTFSPISTSIFWRETTVLCTAAVFSIPSTCQPGALQGASQESTMMEQ